MNYRTSLPKQKAIIYHDFDLLLWATVSYKCRFHKIIDCYNHQMLLWLFSPEFSPPSGRGSYISLVSCRNGGEWIKCLTCFLTLMEKYVWKTSNLTKLSALGWQFVATSFVCTFVAVIKCPSCIHGVLKRVNPLYGIFSIQNSFLILCSTDWKCQYHSVIFPRGVVHRVENGWGLTKVAAVLLNGLLW